MGRGFQGCFWCCFSISPLIMYGIYKIILSGDSANDMALLETKMPECASFINVMVNFYLGMAIYGFVFCFLGCIHPLMMVVGMLLLFIGLTFPGVWACMGISRCGGQKWRDLLAENTATNEFTNLNKLGNVSLSLIILNISNVLVGPCFVFVILCMCCTMGMAAFGAKT